jgi:hypothetical protein
MDGVRRIEGRGFMTVGGERDLPVANALEQNYPNPFNPQTVIRYSIRENCHVRLAVYNVLGQMVCTLVDEHQTAGQKSVNWNPGELASGIYFYRLQAGDFIQTRKMTLIR